MSDPEYEFRKKALVHSVLAVAVVVPLLVNYIFHLRLSVKWSQYSVDPGEELNVLMACDSVLILGAGLAYEGPEFGANRFKFRLSKKQALLGFRDNRLHNMI